MDILSERAKEIQDGMGNKCGTDKNARSFSIENGAGGTRVRYPRHL